MVDLPQGGAVKFEVFGEVVRDLIELQVLFQGLDDFLLHRQLVYCPLLLHVPEPLKDILLLQGREVLDQLMAGCWQQQIEVLCYLDSDALVVRELVLPLGKLVKQVGFCSLKHLDLVSQVLHHNALLTLLYVHDRHLPLESGDVVLGLWQPFEGGNTLVY